MTDMTKLSQDDKLAEVHARLKELVPHFNGVDGDVVGGILGQLVGMYLAGHNPEIRTETRASFDRMVTDLVDLMDARPDSPWAKGETRQ